MIKNQRTNLINELIGNGVRHIHKIGTEKFCNCEVCWTCKFFDQQTSECFVRDEDVKRSLSSSMGEKYYSARATIRKPTWFRCLAYEER